METSAAVSVISVHARHTVRTITVRDDVLVWVRRGHKSLYNVSTHEAVRAGEVVLMARGFQWDVTNDPAPHGRYEAVVVQFGTQAKRQFDRLYRAEFSVKPLGGCAKPDADATLSHILNQTVEILGQSGESQRRKTHRVVELLILLAERGYVFHPYAELGWADKIRHLVSQRPYAEWNVEAMASHFQMSVSTLRRRLASADVTLGQIVRDVRLETGLWLLQTTELSIGEVAHQCGYASQSKFATAFRLRYGLVPSALRDST